MGVLGGFYIEPFRCLSAPLFWAFTPDENGARVERREARIKIKRPRSVQGERFQSLKLILTHIIIRDLKNTSGAR